jgi:probable HAF family extracellular repeat protein
MHNLNARKLSIDVFVRVAILVPLLGATGQRASAQQQSLPPHYKFVDLGTFGGRASYINPAWELGAPLQMNRRNATVGAAATSVLTPFGCVFCNGLDGQVPTVFHAFQWFGGSLRDLGALPGELTNSVAISINEKGTVIGHSENGEIDPIIGVREVRAVLWKNGRIKDLGTLGGSYSVAFGINNRDQIAGSALNTTPNPVSFLGLFLGSSNSTQTRVFLWENERKRDLGTLGGPDAFGGLLNARGEVSGFSYMNSTPNPATGFPTSHPFLWRNGHMIDLGTLGGTFAGVAALNNRSQVIGASNLADDQTSHPFLWQRGKMMDLSMDSVGGSPYTANAINDAGQIIGAAAFPDNPYDAYVWQNGVVRDLGVLPEDCASEAFAMNSKGDVVGQSYSCNGPLDFNRRVFLWQDGSMFDVSSLIAAKSGFYITQAFVINDRGAIGGIGTPPGCDFDEDCGHAYVLLPCDSDDDNNDLECKEAAQNAMVSARDSGPSNSRKLLRGPDTTAKDLAFRARARLGRGRILNLPGFNLK